MRVIALVPGGIGDQILFFPTLEGLKKAYPNAQIDVVVEPRSQGAYRLCPWVHEVLLFDFKGPNSLADWGNLLGVMRDREYDVALSLGRNWGVGLLLWLTGIPTRIGYSGSAGQGFLTNPVPLNANQYAAAMYHDLLQGLGINAPCPEVTLQLPKKDLEWAETEQKRLGISGGGYVLIHGGSSELSKRKGIDKLYPIENWQAIITDFQKRQPDLPVVLVQGPDDKELVSDLLAENPGLKTTSPPDIGSLAALIAGASLILCTDSGPMHLAIAVQAYTVALFGPTDPAKLVLPSDRILTIKSPSGRMADIAPATVLERVWGG